ncbi:MAG: hypothetical protein NT004_06620 [Bacteroidetes bacterium]|nr:hypothetical protein [Bacteroidota bacterium]
MKRFYRFFVLLGFILTFTTFYSFSQVGINANGIPPDPSAGLDVNFNNKGFLMPRMTFAERNAIPNPAEGLMVFCTNCNSDGSGLLSSWQGGKWRNILWLCTPVTPMAGIHIPEVTQIKWNWDAVQTAIGYKWNTTNNFTTANDIGISTSYTETGLTCQTPYMRYVWAYNACGQSSELMLSQSTSQIPFSPAPTEGVHIPSINQIVWNWNPVSGATGYKWSATDNFATAINTGLDTSKTETGLICNTAYTRFVWAYTVCGNSISTMLTQTTSVNPAPPVAGVHVPSENQIVWNWNVVSGATGYKWSANNDYSLATNMGTSTSKTETNLTCGTAYTRYAWAYNECGFSTPVSLTQTTVACCGIFALTINHVAGVVAPVTKTTTYGTVNGIPGESSKCWITSNLGSDHQATAVSDATEPSAGWYWQFNRKQGYKHDGTNRIPNTTWITSINESSDWIIANDPCNIELGAAWRIPTYTEWYNVDNTGGWINWNGPWGSGLKLHAAGYLYYSSGSLYNRGSDGYYWSSTQGSSTDGYNLVFNGGGSGVYSNVKAYGFSLRCLRDY